MPIDGLAAIILAGGRSERMGARKESLMIAGETLLARAIRRIRTVAEPVVVVGTPGVPVPAVAGGVILTNDPRPFAGPLSGFVSGLEALPPETEFAFLIGCDYPIWDPSVTRLLAERIGNHDVAVPVIGGHRQPMSALYRTRLLAASRKANREGWHGPKDLCERSNCREVTEAEIGTVDPSLSSFQSFSTPEDWQQLLEEIATIERDS